MNWKRFARVGAEVIGAVAIVVLCVKACQDGNIRDEVKDVQAKVADARAAVNEMNEQNQALRDSVVMWADSVAFYKQGLKKCEEGKKRAPARRPDAAPVRPARPVVRDTVIVKVDDNKPANVNWHNTRINMNDNTRNNENIIVQNGTQNASMTEITLGNSAVNDGNIVVNNGGNVTIYDNPAAVDSLSAKVDSLLVARQNNNAAASSVVIIKKVKTYQRTR